MLFGQWAFDEGLVLNNLTQLDNYEIVLVIGKERRGFWALIVEVLKREMSENQDPQVPSKYKIIGVELLCSMADWHCLWE